MKKISSLFATLLLLAGVHSASAQSLSVYASAPGVQTADGSGYTSAAGFTVQTEGLENISTTASGAAFPTPYTSPTITLTTATFTTTGSVSVYAAGSSGESRYGGNGQGNFLAIPNGAANSATLSFNSPVGYFGFLFPAADAGSTITFYGAGTNPIATFSTSDLVNLLQSHATLTSLDGKSTYSSSSFYGQPSTGFNNGEPYAYLSFIPSTGVTISKAVLNEKPGSGSFEADNFSVMTTAPQPMGTFVPVGVIPEPSAYVAVMLGAAALGYGLFRRNAGSPARG